MQYHNGNILPLLPGAPATNASYSPDDLKDIIFNSMPEEQRDAFDLLIDMDNATLPVLVKYMEKRNNQANKKGKATNPTNKKTDSDKNNKKENNHPDNQRRKGNGGGKGRGKGRGRDNNQDCNQQGRIKDSDPCPLPGHNGHTWGQCFQNITNNPEVRGWNSNNNNQNGNNNNNNNRDNHINENNQDNRNNGIQRQRNNQEQNPQQGYNCYCTVINETPKINDYIDLFRTDWVVDEDYFENDLQHFPTATVKSNKEEKPTVDLSPTTVTVYNQINDGPTRRIYLKTLFDSGSTNNIANKAILPTDTQYLKLQTLVVMRTAQSTYDCKEYCILKNALF